MARAKATTRPTPAKPLRVEVAADRVISPPTSFLHELGQGAVPDDLRPADGSGLAFRLLADVAAQCVYLERSDGATVRVRLGALSRGILEALAREV